jgi:uncharacterized membrane protein
MCCMMHDMDHSGQNMQTMAASAPQNDSLLDTLRVKRRYALGEITREQFEEMKRVLGVTEGEPMTRASEEHNHH